MEYSKKSKYKFEKVNLLGFEFVSSPNLDSIVDYIISFDINSLEQNKIPLVLPINVDLLVKLETSFNEIKNKLINSFIILPDGQPIVWSSYILSEKRIKKRLAGSDLFPPLWEKIKEKKLSVVLILPSKEIEIFLKKEYPEAITIVAPYLDYPINKSFFNKFLEKVIINIEKYEPKFVLIGLGFPKQELIVLETIKVIKKKDCKLPIFITLGASFEFYTGIKKRAPKVLQSIGLEWLYRFFSEPKRLYKRYFIEDPKFLKILIKELQKRNKMRE